MNIHNAVWPNGNGVEMGPSTPREALGTGLGEAADE